MGRDEISGGVSRSGYKGDLDTGHRRDGETVPTADAPLDSAAGKPAEHVEGAARGSGQSTGHGNAGEEPDSDPQGGDGSMLRTPPNGQ